MTFTYYSLHNTTVRISLSTNEVELYDQGKWQPMNKQSTSPPLVPSLFSSCVKRSIASIQDGSNIIAQSNRKRMKLSFCALPPELILNILQYRYYLLIIDPKVYDSRDLFGRFSDGSIHLLFQNMMLEGDASSMSFKEVNSLLLDRNTILLDAKRRFPSLTKVELGEYKDNISEIREFVTDYTINLEYQPELKNNILMEQIMSLTNLRHLHLTAANLYRQEFGDIIVKCPLLNTLEILRCNIKDSDVFPLELLNQNTSIMCLYLLDNGFRYPLDALRNLRPFKALAFGELIEEYLLALSDNPNIKTLRIFGFQRVHAKVQQLFSKMENLERVFIFAIRNFELESHVKKLRAVIDLIPDSVQDVTAADLCDDEYDELHSLQALFKEAQKKKVAIRFEPWSQKDEIISL
jgi:phage terminase Nu1 subunit (DNA packaging protein)